MSDNNSTPTTKSSKGLLASVFPNNRIAAKTLCVLSLAAWLSIPISSYYQIIFLKEQTKTATLTDRSHTVYIDQKGFQTEEEKHAESAENAAYLIFDRTPEGPKRVKLLNAYFTSHAAKKLVEHWTSTSTEIQQNQIRQSIEPFSIKVSSPTLDDQNRVLIQVLIQGYLFRAGLDSNNLPYQEPRNVTLKLSILRNPDPYAYITKPLLIDDFVITSS